MSDKKAAKQLCELVERGDLQHLHHVANSDNVNLRHLGCTPLMEAACNTNGAACAQHLLKIGADAMCQDFYGNSAMHMAAMRNNIAVMKVLPHTPSLINLQNAVGDTPLMLAAGFNRPDAAKQLISWKADLSIRNKDGSTAIEIARDCENWSALIAITDVNKKTQLPEKEKEQLIAQEQEARQLCELAERCQLEQLQQAANSHNCNRKWNSRTPLMFAAMAANNAGLECVRLLLQLGADARIVDCRGWSAAYHAVYHGNTEVLQLLPKACANLADKFDVTPLMLAAVDNRANAVQLLLEMGAELNASDFKGRTAMDKAKGQGFNSMVALLTEAAERQRIEDENWL